MAKNVLFRTFLAISLAVGIIVCGCATSVASPNIPLWAQEPIGTGDGEYIVLGSVSLEGVWDGVFGASILSLLGVSVPNVNVDTFLLQRGGITYSDLLAEARKKYKNANAVVNVTVEQKRSNHLLVIHSRSTIIMTGIAVQYTDKKPAASNPIVKVQLIE